MCNVGIILFFLMVTHNFCQAQQVASTIIRNIIVTSQVSGSDIHLEGERIYNRLLLTEFYDSSHYMPGWDQHENSTELLSAIRHAGEEGLNPSDYHWKQLKQYASDTPIDEQHKVMFDLLMTDAFLTYGTHLFFGKLNPEKLYPGKWEAADKKANIVGLLVSALSQQTVKTSLEGLISPCPGYKRLKDKLKFFNSQFSHGDTTCIHLSGGKKYSIEECTHKILANLERHRWFPCPADERCVVINIPDFQLRVLEKDSLIMEMRAIVGRPDRSTPIFSSSIRYLILNPSWTVPPTILKEDILPIIQQDSLYLTKNNLRVIDKSGREVDPETINWRKYSAERFPFQLRQDPGLYNAMGLIKFQFKNRHNVFLHDTNMRSLFNETYRALSSGCIRIEQPFTLARHLLRGTSWDEKKISRAIATGNTITITFPEAIPIHLQYFTAYVDDANNLVIKSDIYQLDTVLLENLNEFIIPTIFR